MLIGVPKEIKNHEYRVGMVPSGVCELIENGHQVIVETGAALGIGISDADYVAMMAIGYVVIGNIQKQFPPYYKERIETYCKETSEMFGSLISPIVD